MMSGTVMLAVNGPALCVDKTDYVDQEADAMVLSEFMCEHVPVPVIKDAFRLLLAKFPDIEELMSGQLDSHGVIVKPVDVADTDKAASRASLRTVHVSNTRGRGIYDGWFHGILSTGVLIEDLYGNLHSEHAVEVRFTDVKDDDRLD
jgi:hypothetical protein